MSDLGFPVFKSSELDIDFYRNQSQRQFEILQENDNILRLTEQALRYERCCYLAEYSPESDVYAKVTLIFDEYSRNLVTDNFHFTEIRKGNHGNVEKCIKQKGWDSILVKYQFDKREYVNHPKLRHSEFKGQGPDVPTKYYIDVWIPIRFISSKRPVSIV